MELNLPTDKIIAILWKRYTAWDILLQKSVKQELQELRDRRDIIFRSNWITFVALNID